MFLFSDKCKSAVAETPEDEGKDTHDALYKIGTSETEQLQKKETPRCFYYYFGFILDYKYIVLVSIIQHNQSNSPHCHLFSPPLYCALIQYV